MAIMRPSQALKDTLAGIHWGHDHNALLEVSPQVHDPRQEFRASVDAGLAQTPPRLECRFLYDEVGTHLFDAICNQPEYYPTRTEAGILEQHAEQIRQAVGASTLVELGSGLSAKTRFLLDAWTHQSPSVRYVAVDVSDSALVLARTQLCDRYASLQFLGLHGTYEEAFPLIPALPSPVTLVFMGSSLGNLTPDETRQFMQSISLALRPGDHFLLGVDLVKPVEILEAAYNDQAGVTAQFTLNIFARMNRELGTQLELDGLEHQAIWNPALEQIEIDVLVKRDQELVLSDPESRHRLRAGSRIRVEISRKFRIEPLSALLSAFGLRLEATYTDEQQWFAALLFRRVEDGQRTEEGCGEEKTAPADHVEDV